jgi:ketosteroid isomerase-like protein
MSQENVEIVRRGFQAFADRGFDAMAEFWDPDTFGGRPRAPMTPIEHGQVAAPAYGRLIDTFDDYSVVVDELRTSGMTASFRFSA